MKTNYFIEYEDDDNPLDFGNNIANAIRRRS